MTERPEHIRCIAVKPQTRPPWKTFCGKLDSGFLFQSLAHARAAIASGSRLVPCPECLALAEEL